MTLRHPQFRPVAAIALLALAGCNGGVEPPQAPSKPAPTPFDAAAARAREATEATKQAESKPAAPTKKAAVAAAPSYTPPFPERTDLFTPPKQGARVARQSDDDTPDSVVLLGFADLDGPRVVLSIDTLVKPLGSGEELAGVKVISIAPPRAVLERGRARWTASLE